MRTAILAFLLLSTSACALIPEPKWMANHRKDRRYCESARANGWDGPMARSLRCGVDPFPVAPKTETAQDSPCTVITSFWSPAYSENRVIRRLQVLKLWPMGRVLVFAPGPGMVRPAVNDPGACPGG